MSFSPKQSQEDPARLQRQEVLGGTGTEKEWLLPTNSVHARGNQCLQQATTTDSRQTLMAMQMARVKLKAKLNVVPLREGGGRGGGDKDRKEIAEARGSVTRIHQTHV